jgi:hypothetical protein
LTGAVHDSETRGPAWFAFGRALLVESATATDGATLATTRSGFHDSLDDDGAFSVLVANAALTTPEAEVLALLATAEIDSSCRQLVAALRGDGQADRITLGALGQILGNDHPGALAVAPTSALRRTAFVDIGTDGPWADHRVALHQSVIWSLLGDTSPDPDLPVGVIEFELDDASAAGDSHFVVAIPRPPTTANGPPSSGRQRSRDGHC